MLVSPMGVKQDPKEVEVVVRTAARVPGYLPAAVVETDQVPLRQGGHQALSAPAAPTRAPCHNTAQKVS